MIMKRVVKKVKRAILIKKIKAKIRYHLRVKLNVKFRLFFKFHCAKYKFFNMFNKVHLLIHFEHLLKRNFLKMSLKLGMNIKKLIQIKPIQ
jgi:hypothetical protein